MAAPEALVGEAERALVLSDYWKAEKRAKEACQLAASQGGGVQRDLLDRASVVALQTLYETQRFGLAHKFLRETFGSTSAAPPNTLLLWLALALDTESRREAERLIQELLETRQPASGSNSSGNSTVDDSNDSSAGTGWSRHQYLALLHLYVFELLLPELREPAEVMRWVQETQLPIIAEERKLLVQELEQYQQQYQQQQHQRQHQRRASEGAGGGASAREVKGSARPARGARHAGGEGGVQGEEADADEERIFQPQDAQHTQHPTSHRRVGSKALAAHSSAAGASCEIEPDAAAAGELVQPSALSLDWLGRCQQQVLQGAAAILRPLLGLPAEPWQEKQHVGAAVAPGRASTINSSSGGDTARDRHGQAHSSQQSELAVPDAAVTLRQLSRTVLGCVLLYAAYAERRAIKRGMSRAQRFVSGGVADLLRMAFNLGINPLAA